MWRNITAENSQSKNVAAFASRVYKLAGVRAVVAELAAQPLVLILLGGVWSHGWDWRLLVLFPLAALCGVYTAGLRVFHQTGRVYEQLVDLYEKHPHWRFTPITTSDYLEALYRNTLAGDDERDEAREREFAKNVLTGSEYYGGEHLRLVVIETDEQKGVGVLATFATLTRAWVFLDGDPRAMRGFEHFKVLHEVGHTDPAGMQASYAARGNMTLLLLALPPAALMLKWETNTLLLAAAYVLVFLSLTKLTLRWLRRHMRFVEEFYADVFALERCPRHWFEGFSEQDVKEFAEAVCGGGSGGGADEHTSPAFDAPLTAEQVKWRRIVLANRLNTMLRGDHYAAQETIPVLWANLTKLAAFFQNAVLIALALALGFQQAGLTTARFVALVVVMLLIILVGLAFVQLNRGLAAHWDSNLNVKPPSEHSPSELKALEDLRRGVLWRERFDAWKARRDDRR